MERIPITRDGLEKLKAELSHLEAVERPQNIRAIEEARAHGDLSENAEYAGWTVDVDPAGGLIVRLETGQVEWFDPMRTKLL